ncbi:MAG: caspase family protein [Chloroflexi bacterium]|nr:caspase family protein [Chloroflexota bacterium]
MSRFAVVIGIDAYANPAWNLTAAVSDALRFTEWALGPGGVAFENLRLLLSPTQANATHLPYKEATSRHIVETIQEFQEGLAQGADRLYFYFAGHGLSAPDVSYGGPLEPVMIPADVESIRMDSRLLIGFSDVFPPFANVDPAEQFFFIDACRDFELEDFKPAVGRSVGPWIPGRTEPGSRSAQYILYATSPGHSAYEETRGRGVFATALLDGLKGKGPAIVWSQANTCYEVRFSSLVACVKSRVQQEVERRRPRDWQRYVQIPQQQIQGGAEDPVLVAFSGEEVSRVPIRVRVRPSAARQSGEIQALQYFQGRQRFEVIDRVPPPVPLPCQFQLLPGDYSLFAQAEGYKPRREAFSFYEPQEVDWKLEPAAAPTSEQTVEPKPWSRLVIFVQDENAIVVIRDADRRLIWSGPGSWHQALPPGVYQVQLVLPEGTVRQKTAEVLPDQTTIVSMDSPPPQIGSHQIRMLDELGISVTHPSEHLGDVAKPTLASLLSFAAFAALWPWEGFERLRNLGIQRFEGIPESGSGCLVLIGVGGDRPAPGVSTAQFLSEGQLVARGYQGQVMDQGGFAVLPEFSVAGQRRFQIQPGPLTLELDLPGFAPTRYALVGLLGRITVLVAVAEEGGEFAVQQYLLPLPQPTPVPEYLLEMPSNIRRLEIAQRYYANGQQIPNYQDLDILLYGKWLDPLLGCLAGYSLIRTGNQQRYIGHPLPGPGPNYPEPSALRNMLRFFSGLPDSHILAGLCEPERRGEHYAHALEQGLPVFAEGFRILYEWYAQQDAELPPLLVEPGKGLLPVSPWTAWVFHEGGGE